jgi:hypothetical protein
VIYKEILSGKRITETKPIFKYHHQDGELNHGTYDSYEAISKYGRVQVSGKASKNKQMQGRRN